MPPTVSACVAVHVLVEAGVRGVEVRPVQVSAGEQDMLDKVRTAVTVGPEGADPAVVWPSDGA